MNLSTAFALVTYNNDTDAAAIEAMRCERTNAAGASNAEVNGMSSRLGEVRCSSPMDRRREDVVAK